MTPDDYGKAALKFAGTTGGGELLPDYMTDGDLAAMMDWRIGVLLDHFAHFAAHIAKEHGNSEFLAEVERMRKK